MATQTLQQYKMFIGGEWVAAKSGKTFTSLNPYTQQPWAEVPEGDAGDVDRAVQAAEKAYETTWWRKQPRERARLLLRLADLLEQSAERLGVIESTDNGKVIREMLGMNRATHWYYRHAASLAEQIFGDVITGGSPTVFSYTLREPYGIVGVQLPWNTPLIIMAQAAAPALAAGNVLVIKPSEFAPASTIEFAALAEKAGFPPGVINVVTGMGPVVGAAVCNHPKVSKIAFTGSPEAGKIVAGQAAKRLVPVVMELGGKSPNIVFEDADLDKAIAGVLGGFTAAAGQSCVCGSRALIQESVYKRVVDAVAEGVKKIKIGDPSKPETDMGPFCTIQQLEKVKRFVEAGKKEGARVVVGGSQPQEPKGWFFEPTVFADVKNSMTIAQEEIFGPVLSALSFKDEAEAVRIANDTRFGLAAGLWTRDISRAHRVARELRAGTIWINQYRRGDPAFPFGGFKESGYGRENGRDAILEFTQAKSVQIELGG